jgi:hypothetical protein
LNIKAKREQKRLEEKQQNATKVDPTSSMMLSDADLQLTKKYLQQSGKKAIPSHTGPKIRHKPRHNANEGTVKKTKAKDGVNKKSRKDVRAEKRTRKEEGGGAPSAKKKKGNASVSRFLTLN